MNKHLKLKTLILASLLASIIFAYDKSNRIVQYYDEIYVYPTGDNSTLEMDVAMYPFSQPYKNMNNTKLIDNYLCWAKNYEVYIDECFNTPEGLDSTFVIINQYNQQDDDTANFLNKINNGTEGADHIKGFILASELQVSDVDVAYYLPEIIS
jgi:hypothetical protein